MRLIRVLFTCLLVGFARSTHAQPFPSSMARKGTLASLDSIKLSKGGLECGPYFRFDGKLNPSRELGKFGVLTFIYVDTNRTEIQVMAPDKIQFYLSGKDKSTPAVPTVKVIRDAGPVYPWFEIQISENDFKKAPCLVDSKVIRER